MAQSLQVFCVLYQTVSTCVIHFGQQIGIFSKSFVIFVCHPNAFILYTMDFSYFFYHLGSTETQSLSVLDGEMERANTTKYEKKIRK